MGPKPCDYYWGGECELEVLPPFYDCELHHAPAWLTGRVEVTSEGRWSADGPRSTEFPEELLASSAMTEDLINLAIERIDLGPAQMRNLATNPNLPLAHFEKVIDVKAVPIRAASLSPADMEKVLEVAAPVAWLTAYSEVEVPGDLWEQVGQIELKPAVGPLPASVNSVNVQRLSDMVGDPGFHHSVIAAIKSKRLPLEYALRALGRIRRAPDVDSWDVEEATEAVAEYVSDITGKDLSDKELFAAADRLLQEG